MIKVDCTVSSELDDIPCTCYIIGYRRMMPIDLNRVLLNFFSCQKEDLVLVNNVYPGLADPAPGQLPEDGFCMTGYGTPLVG